MLGLWTIFSESGVFYPVSLSTDFFVLDPCSHSNNSFSDKRFEWAAVLQLVVNILAFGMSVRRSSGRHSGGRLLAMT